MIKVKTTLNLRPRRRPEVKAVIPASPAPAGRMPRIARLMALAIQFDDLLRTGQVSDQSELARLAHITQPRMTQIMNLLHLAPDIQEDILIQPPVMEGRDLFTERNLRPLTRQTIWKRQRVHWRRLQQQVETSFIPPPSRSPAVIG